MPNIVVNQMPSDQRIIDKWYENFVEQISQPPYSVNPDIPVDTGRIYTTLSQAAPDGKLMGNPLNTDQTLSDNRNELYRLASEGRLYIFPLAEDAKCSQIRIEPAEKLLYDLQTEVTNQEEPPRPVAHSLNWIKDILNRLFGLFEEERLQLQNQLDRDFRRYMYHRQGTLCERNAVNTVGSERVFRIGRDQEKGRSALPSTIRDLNAKLQNDNLLPWERDCTEAKIQLYTAMHEGSELTGELYLNAIAQAMISRLGEYADKEMYHFQKPTELQRLLHEEPEKAQEYIDLIKENTYIRSIVDQENILAVFSVCSTVQGTDALIDRWLRDLEKGNDQQKAIAADTRQMMSTSADTIETLQYDIESENRFVYYLVDAQTARAKLELLTAQRDNKSLSVEQCQDILAKIIVGRMGKSANDREASQPNELRDLLRKDPDLVNKMTETVKNTDVVKNMAQRADINEIDQNTRTIKALDQLVKAVLNEATVVIEQMSTVENSKEIVNDQIIEAEQPQDKPISFGIGG